MYTRTYTHHDDIICNSFSGIAHDCFCSFSSRIKQRIKREREKEIGRKLLLLFLLLLFVIVQINSFQFEREGEQLEREREKKNTCRGSTKNRAMKIEGRAASKEI